MQVPGLPGTRDCNIVARRQLQREARFEIIADRARPQSYGEDLTQIFVPGYVLRTSTGYSFALVFAEERSGKSQLFPTAFEQFRVPEDRK